MVQKTSSFFSSLPGGRGRAIVRTATVFRVRRQWLARIPSRRFPMIRPTAPSDTPRLLKLADGTGVFKPSEIVALREVPDDHHTDNHGLGHRSLVWEEGSRVVGFAYYAPAAMTDRTWYLWWIAVERSLHGQGVGGRLLRAAEEEVRA